MKDTRSKLLLALRPEIPKAKVYENMNVEEHFQNATLRSVLKLQHNLLIAVFRHYMSQKKVVFAQLSKSKQVEYIDQVFFKDQRFKNSLKGVVIGQFTMEEYETYLENVNAINKRLFSMMKQRFLDSLSDLENA